MKHKSDRWAVMGEDGRKIAKVEGFEAAALSAVAELLKHKSTGSIVVRERLHDEKGEPKTARSYAISIRELPRVAPGDDGGSHRDRAVMRMGKRKGNPTGRYTLDGEPVDLEDFLSVNENLGSETIEQIRRLAPGEGILLGGGAYAEFYLHREADKASRQSRARYTLDGEPVDLEDFLSVNENLGRETIEQIRRLGPGEGVELGGGAYAEFDFRREMDEEGEEEWEIDGERTGEAGLGEFLASGEVSPREARDVRALGPGESVRVGQESRDPRAQHTVRRIS